jgi:hypothetical protein
MLAGWTVNKFGPGIGLYVIGGTISVGAVAVAALTGGHRAISNFVIEKDSTVSTQTRVIHRSN